jgi:short-subunit dehydrogenase
MKSLIKRYGKWALITGASSGIGFEFAKNLAIQGFNLVLVARRSEQLNTQALEFKSLYNIDVRVVAIDLTEPNAVRTLYDNVSGLDIGLIIPSAGVDEMGEFLTRDYAALERMIRLNVNVPTELIHMFGSRLTSRKKSGVILVSSLFGYQGIPHFSTYAATKAYILMLGEALNVELRKNGIDVLVLSPGLTDTPFAHSLEMNLSLLPMFVQKPKSVAMIGLKNLGRGATVVPGLLNKLYAWENRLLPRSWPVKLFGALIGNAVRSFSKKKKNEQLISVIPQKKTQIANGSGIK